MADTDVTLADAADDVRAGPWSIEAEPSWARFHRGVEGLLTVLRPGRARWSCGY